jgi:hypothetical protein
MAFRPNGVQTTKMALGPNGAQAKWRSGQMAFRPKWRSGQMALKPNGDQATSVAVSTAGG